jgi:cell fate regulator YaaT (PSP1 superfamily)
MSDINAQQPEEAQKNYSDSNKKKNFPKEEITEDNCPFDDGEELKFTRVRFPGHAKSYAFLMGNRSLMYGQKVVAMSDRGMAVGYINSFPYLKKFTKNMLPLRSINKIASDHDIEKELEVYKRQKEIETTCQRLIEKHELDMNMTHVEFTQFGKKVVFYFTAPARVDFRGLVKDLVGELRLRIELRQISVRDRAASVGAIGPCGRELCCSSFLSRYGNVSIKMAKNQNLTLNYSKLNGVCGQLKCCLSYEEDVYTEKRKKLPSEGSFVKTKTGDSGRVRKLNILSEQFDMLTDRGHVKRYTFDQVTKRLDKDYKFPNRFDNISDETGKVIGESELEISTNNDLKREYLKTEKKAAKFAIEKLIEIADFLPEKESGEREKILEQANEDIKNALEQKIESNYNPYHQDFTPPPTSTTDTIDEVQTNTDHSKDNSQAVKAKEHKPKQNRNNKNRNRNRNRNRNNKPKAPKKD